MLVWWWVAGGEGQFWEEELVYSRVYLGEQEEEERRGDQLMSVSSQGWSGSGRTLRDLSWPGLDS